VIAAGIALILAGLAVLIGARRLLRPSAGPSGRGSRRATRKARRAAQAALPPAPARLALTTSPAGYADSDAPDADEQWLRSLDGTGAPDLTGDPFATADIRATAAADPAADPGVDLAADWAVDPAASAPSVVGVSDATDSPDAAAVAARLASALRPPAPGSEQPAADPTSAPGPGPGLDGIGWPTAARTAESRGGTPPASKDPTPPASEDRSTTASPDPALPWQPTAGFVTPPPAAPQSFNPVPAPTSAMPAGAAPDAADGSAARTERAADRTGGWSAAPDPADVVGGDAGAEADRTGGRSTAVRPAEVRNDGASAEAGRRRRRSGDWADRGTVTETPDAPAEVPEVTVGWAAVADEPVDRWAVEPAHDRGEHAPGDAADARDAGHGHEPAPRRYRLVPTPVSVPVFDPVAPTFFEQPDPVVVPVFDATSTGALREVAAEAERRNPAHAADATEPGLWFLRPAAEATLRHREPPWSIADDAPAPADGATPTRPDGPAAPVAVPQPEPDGAADDTAAGPPPWPTPSADWAVAEAPWTPARDETFPVVAESAFWPDSTGDWAVPDAGRMDSGLPLPPVSPVVEAAATAAHAAGTARIDTDAAGTPGPDVSEDGRAGDGVSADDSAVADPDGDHLSVPPASLPAQAAGAAPTAPPSPRAPGVAPSSCGSGSGRSRHPPVTGRRCGG
jgi:hypothetical protein